MRTAITGGNGFLAGYCCDFFVKQGIDVRLLARHQGSYKNHKYIVTDYSRASLHEILCNEKIDSVVHLAGPRKVYSDITDYNDYFKMTTALYDVCVEIGISNIVFASSISVYSGAALPYKESTLPYPCSNYGLSKLVGEQIGNIHSLKKELAVKNLRLAHLYGANEKNSYMINKFFREGFEHRQITVNAHGKAQREMMYTKDAAWAIYFAISHQKLSGTFNIGSGEFLTNEDIAKQICRYMSPEKDVIIGSEKEKIKSSYMDCISAKQVLGYEPHYTLASALPEIYEEMRHNSWESGQ